jgi:hypothetical protein
MRSNANGAHHSQPASVCGALPTAPQPQAAAPRTERLAYTSAGALIAAGLGQERHADALQPPDYGHL